MAPRIPGFRKADLARGHAPADRMTREFIFRRCIHRRASATVRVTAWGSGQGMCPRPSQTQSEERADTLADERKSQQVGPTDIYIVRVKLNRAEAVNIPDFSPTPGMEVYIKTSERLYQAIYIKTSERTLFQYIVKPIL